MGGRKTKQVTVGEVKESTPKIVAEPKTEKRSSKKLVKRSQRVRGKNYRTALEKTGQRIYPVEEAVKKVKESSYAGFDASVDAHINLGLGGGKPEEHQLRSFLALPHGTGKSIHILVFADGEEAKAAQEMGADKIGSDATIEEIAQGKLAGIDAVIATPAFMPKLAKVARVLGPKGLMPTPKTGTVVDKPATVVATLKKGRVELKTEAQPIIHVSIGKVSFQDSDLVENLKAVIAELNRIKPPKVTGTYIRSIFLASTMGPSVRIDPTSL